MATRQGRNGGTLKILEKGEVLNPNGRPKGSLNRSTVAKKWLQATESFMNPITKQTERLSEEDIMTLALIKEARAGNVAAYRAVMDSAYGTPDMKITQEKRAMGETIQLETDYTLLTDDELREIIIANTPPTLALALADRDSGAGGTGSKVGV